MSHYPGQGYGHGHGPGGYGGYPPPSGPPPPPPGADPQLWQWFSAVDTDRSNHISVTELQVALKNGDWSPFDLDTVKLLMSMFDTDLSGTIGFNEFAGLWKYIKDWQGVYQHFDKDRSGSIDGGELQAALKQFGYNLSPQLLNLVEKKYVMSKAAPTAPAPTVPGFGPGFGSHPPSAGPVGITFDRFVRACVVIKQVTASFQKLDTDRDGWIQINYDQFMQVVLGAP